MNIINFIRGCEPRLDIDLLEPVLEQIALVDSHGLPATFLLQHDARGRGLRHDDLRAGRHDYAALQRGSV